MYTPEAITPEDFAMLIPSLLAARDPVILYGPPGCGKTTLIREACPVSHDLVEVDMAAQTDADFGGLVDIAALATVWKRPAWMPEPGAKPQFVILDDLPLATMDAQRLATTLMQLRRIRGHYLPFDSMVWITANRAIDGTRAVPLISTVKTRALVYHMMPHAPSWLKWAKTMDIQSDIQGYISAHPTALNPAVADGTTSTNDANQLFVQGTLSGEYGWPCPRTFHLLSNNLKSLYSNNPNPPWKLLSMISHAAIGPLAPHFLAWLESNQNIRVTLADIVLNPNTAALPTNPNEAVVVARRIANDIKEGMPFPTTHPIANLDIYLRRLKDTLPEAGRAAISIILTVCPSLVTGYPTVIRNLTQYMTK